MGSKKRNLVTTTSSFKDFTVDRFAHSKIYRVFRYGDFRLFWLGAFLSFSGSWIQRIAEGYFVFQLTHDESRLAFVSFCSSIPVFFLGFIAGSLSDTYDKRRVLIITQLLFAAGAIYLAIATWGHFVSYNQIVIVALLLGVVSTVEMPTRQSIVSRVVPPQDLTAAIPITAMTFNAARIVGPAFGSMVLSWVGVAACYLLNGLSFLALVWTAIAIKADLTSQRSREKQPIKDILFEGMIFTYQDVRLRTLFLLETVTGLFGLFYLALLPAITGDMLGLDRISAGAAKAGLGWCTTCVGVGAISGLILVTSLSDTPRRGLLIRVSMTSLGLSLVLLSFTRTPLFAYPLFAITGASSIIQLNTTNALFQLLAPEKKRGRILALHIWALNGLSPFGLLFFGWIANVSHSWHLTHVGKVGPFEFATDSGGVAFALLIGGALVLVGAVFAWVSRKGFKGLTPDLEPGWNALA